MQTSLKIQIEYVRDSGAREIIKLMKLWRVRNSLAWKTIALEIAVIRALEGLRKDDYAVFENDYAVFEDYDPAFVCARAACYGCVTDHYTCICESCSEH